MKLTRIIKWLVFGGGKELLIKKILFPKRYAKFIGVNFGKNNFFYDNEIWSSEPYLVTIGNNCQITKGVRLFTHGGGQAVRKTHPDFDVFGKIVIGNYVYIGNNSLIMPGVSIGDGVLIAAGSVVTKSIQPHVVVAGNPAKIICTTEDYYNRNSQYDLHSYGLSNKDKRKMLMSLPKEKFLQK